MLVEVISYSEDNERYSVLIYVEIINNEIIDHAFKGAVKNVNGIDLSNIGLKITSYRVYRALLF